MPSLRIQHPRTTQLTPSAVSVSDMRTAVLLCCLLAAVAAAPQRPNRFGGGQFFVPNRFQSFGQPSTANGGANGNVVTGSSSGQGVSSTITQVSAQAGVSSVWRPHRYTSSYEQ